MKPALTILVFTCVLICMFGVVWSQNSSVSNTNANRNANTVNRHEKNFGTNCAPCDPNASWNTANMAANAVNVDWNAANVAANAPARRKAPTRKKRTRRPTASLGGAFTFENSLSAMLAAGVS
ncbi:MAG TPA: hypothetical protein VL572_00380 [Pyrinomonadaceae bacterium]|nr:hypothetical protein [Pyrinomonadaceae bacterium]